VSPTQALSASTIHTTSIYTITSCATTITDCLTRIGSEITETITIYTTVCPVTQTRRNGGSPTGPTQTPIPSSPSSFTKYTASTVYTTSVYTITSCASEVTKRAAKLGSVITETIVLYATICPVTPPPAPQPPSGFTISTVYTKCPSAAPNCPVGSVATEVISLFTSLHVFTQSANNNVLVSQSISVPARPAFTLPFAAVLSSRAAAAAEKTSITVASPPAVLSTFKILPIGASTLGAWKNATSTSTSTGRHSAMSVSGATKSLTTLTGLKSSPPYMGPTANHDVSNGRTLTNLLLAVAIAAIVL